MLSLIFCHPGTSLLTLAGVEVGIEYGQVRAVLVEHLVGFHIGMIYGDILVLLESDAVQLISQSEDTFDNVFQLEIRTQHLLIQVVFLHLQLVAVEGGVPRHHFFHILVSQFLQFLALLQCGGLVGFYQVVQQLIDIACVRRHTTFQHIVCIRLVAHQLGYLPAQVYDALAYFQVVLLIVVRTLCHTRHVHLLSQVALGRVGHEGRVGGHVQCEHPSLFAHILCRQCRSLACRFWQSVQLSLVGDVQGERLLLLQQVLRKLQAQHRGFLRQLAQSFLASFVQKGTCAHESLVAIVQQHLLLVSQPAVVKVHLAYTLEKSGLQTDVVGVLC